MARCFCREMGTDSVAFAAWEYQKVWYNKNPATDDKVRSFLWYDTEEGKPGQWPAIGGCTFRRMGRKRPYWELGWVWIHQDKRRKGLFRSAWPFFRAMFGMLMPTDPSAAMRGFLQSVGYPAELAAYYGITDQDSDENDDPAG